MNTNYMYQTFDVTQNQYQNNIDPRNRSNFINIPNNNRNIQYQQSDMNNPYNYSYINNPPPMNGSLMINQCPPHLQQNNKDNGNMQFTINKGAANVPSHLSSPYRRQDTKNNSGYTNKNKNSSTTKSPINDSWNLDYNTSQGGWNSHMGVSMGGINQSNNWEDLNRLPPQNTNNYRNNNRNNFHELNVQSNTNLPFPQQRNDIRNIKFPTINQPPNNQNISCISSNDINSGQFNPQLNQYGVPVSRSNNNFYNNSPAPTTNATSKQNVGSKNNKNFGGRINYNYNNNQNSNRNIIPQNNTLPGKVGMFNVTEDSFWKNPNEESIKKQKDNGTSIWGDPEKNNSLPIRRWGIPNIPDLVESNTTIYDNKNTNNSSCKIIVATGWGDIEKKDNLKKNQKDLNKITDEGSLYNRDENHWSPGSGKESTFEAFNNNPNSEWNLPGNTNLYSDMMRGFQGNNVSTPSDEYSLSSSSQELLKIAVSKNIISKNILTKFYDPQSSVLLNSLLSLISQAVMLDDKLGSIRRNNMDQNDFEQKQRYNIMIVEIAKIKNEIETLSENLTNRAFGNTISVNSNLPSNYLVTNVHKDINFAAFTDEYLFENISSTTNFHFDSATAAVSRSLANLDISGNGETSDHLLHSDVWK
uniref:GW182 middle domain-containing protein n=1 Tax=Strongyloides stercoralis TaxID=6248 RepID=A0A0K0E623_STRER